MKRPSIESLYVDQASTCTPLYPGRSHKIVYASYTPHGIHCIDSYFIRRIRSGYGGLGAKEALKREIEDCPHLHKTIKDNLLDNLRDGWATYVKEPCATFVPEGSVVMIKDPEYDRPTGTAYGALSKWDGDVKQWVSRMLSDDAGALGVVEWYSADGSISVMLHDGGLITGLDRNAFCLRRISVWDREIEILEHAKVYPKYSH